jgi:osmotically inducible protein OsmC
MKSGLRPRLSRCVALSIDVDAARTRAGPLRQASWLNARQHRHGHKLERTMKRKASAVWQGGLQDGKGTISTDSGVLKDTQYSFATRFEDGIGTNPEELIAAAHAGCFSMALSAELGKAGIKPERIGTTATLTLDKADGGFAITAVHLDVKVKIPGGDRAAFEKATADAKAGCPVSKVLKATITMDATLET